MSIKEKLESLGRNSIQLKIAGKETHKLGATRFGGKPDVPPDFVWPTYEGESYDHVVKDRPLTFLAQFNCAELAQFDKEHLLPDHGLLSFFYETDTQCWGYDPKDQGCARVYWFEDMSALSAADFPADMEEDFKFPMVSSFPRRICPHGNCSVTGIHAMPGGCTTSTGRSRGRIGTVLRYAPRRTHHRLPIILPVTRNIFTKTMR